MFFFGRFLFYKICFDSLLILKSLAWASSPQFLVQLFYKVSIHDILAPGLSKNQNIKIRILMILSNFKFPLIGVERLDFRNLVANHEEDTCATLYSNFLGYFLLIGRFWLILKNLVPEKFLAPDFEKSLPTFIYVLGNLIIFKVVFNLCWRTEL